MSVNLLVKSASCWPGELAGVAYADPANLLLIRVSTENASISPSKIPMQFQQQHPEAPRAQIMCVYLFFEFFRFADFKCNCSHGVNTF